MKYNILIVEDEKELSHIISKYIEKEEYAFQIAENGFKALELFNKNTFHLVLLDVMMPGISGFEVLKDIRSNSNIPVIMLTAKEQEVDKIKGFDYGADDYVTKPFSPRELMKRIKAVFKRVYNENDEIILHVNELKLHINKMKLYKNDKEIILTSTEFHLLKTFMNNYGIVLTRERLIQLSFGYDYEGFDRNIDSYIKRIRKKIEDDPKNPKYLITKYRAGYIFGGEKL
jgi:DNA-binding response OmpR family regulator